MFLVTARIESYPEKLLLFCACATVQLRNARRARQELKMAFTLNYPTSVGNKQLFTSSQLHAHWKK